MNWNVERHRDGVDALHKLGVPEQPTRTVRWCEADRSAFVLGSAQPTTDVDEDACAREHVDVVRRNSGGGAVLVEPNDIVWMDVVIPATDVLWRDDVGIAFEWLGDAIAETLAGIGVFDARVHKGALRKSEWSRAICFAGLGPGEVTVAGQKVVGISQRRTRAGALFQCAVLRNFDAFRVAGLLNRTQDERAQLVSYLQRTVSELPYLDPKMFETAFLQVLSIR